MKFTFKKRYLVIALVGMFAVVMSMMVYVMGFFWQLAYGFPYGKPTTFTADNTPVFAEVPVDFTHHFEGGDDVLSVVGSAVIDVDNDGVEELFVGGGFEQNDAVLRYTPQGFKNVSESLGLAKSTDAATHGATVVDANGDGYSDIYIARNDGVYFYENQAGQSFVETKLDIDLPENTAVMSIAISDLNADGAPDLYLATCLRKPFQEGQSIFNKVGYGTQDILLINTGNNEFEDITLAAGLTYIHNSFQGVFADIDGDTDMDIVVAHDTGTVKTWRNNGDLTFTDMPNPTSDEFAYPMGIAVGDYNNDGKVDFAFSNIGDMGPMTFMVKGDLTKEQVLNDQLILLENQGDFTFKNTAEDMQFGNYEFGWGLVLADFNNDTKEDVVMAQNYIALPPYKFFRSPSRFLLQGARGFESVDHLTDTTNREFSISPLFADFNQDGALDVVLINLGAAPRVFMNEASPAPYVGVILPDTVASFGTKVTVVTDAGNYSKTLYTPQGLGADSTHKILLALPDATVIERIELMSLTKEKRVLTDAMLNTYYEVTQ